MRGTQIAGEDHTSIAIFGGVFDVAFHVSRTEDMPGTLQTNTTGKLWGLRQAEPRAEGKRDRPLLDEFEITLNLLFIAAMFELKRILQHQR